jgi:hypothetical protein
MTLTVTPELLSTAHVGPVDDADFIACVRTSLPYAYEVIADLVDQSQSDGFADARLVPPSDDAQGQLLRAMASTAVRNALERHFGVSIAFQNCFRVAVFGPGALPRYEQFTSTQAQVLNQAPDLVIC